MWSRLWVYWGLMGLTVVTVTGQATYEERNLSGPRFGITILGGDLTANDELENVDIGRVISQFGWHAESQIVPEGGGPALVLQTVMMAGGVEYGTLIPTLSAFIGMRFPSGAEFGVGPTLSVTGTALAVAAGQTFDYSGVSIPLNVAVAANTSGVRVSFLLGYAIRRN